jgi:hypothetical protein
MLVIVSGCALPPPKCNDPTHKAVLQGIFTFGIHALWRANKCRGPESDDELLARGEGLIEQGDVVELYRIGIIFFYFREKMETGYRLICHAAHRNFNRAQDHMASWYEGEENYDTPFIPTDNVQAYKWYTLASMNGLESSKEEIAALGDRMTLNQVAEAERLVAEWQPNAAECEETDARVAN